ncbi:MAG: prepilin-type N-terminal cleavage/methylation domain-containing protein [Chitinivibrionales bacterium]|nr:prepilin-type N-terminal cleavage/methylation domain-containing protein [Chitinivibrionales bacterium]
MIMVRFPVKTEIERHDYMKRNDQSGFTLVEIIIAMFIMTLVAFALHGYLFSFISTNKNSKDIAEATSLGNSKLESLRTTSYDALESNSDIINNKYYRVWEVYTDNDKKTINLIVAWPQETGSHQITLSTIIAEP